MEKLKGVPFGLAAIAMCIGCSRIAAAQSTCAPFEVIPLDGGRYNFQMNESNSSLLECADLKGVGFTITTAKFDSPTNGAPAAFTSIYRGCHWGVCTSSNPFPIQEGNIASTTTSVGILQPPGYSNNAAYDIWFSRNSATFFQPDGAEVMIWLNHQGSIQPFGSKVATKTINNTQYDVWTGDQSSWKVVTYVASTPVTAVTNMNLLPFFADAVARGSLRSSWWLIDVEYGFEIWKGGKGLGMSSFSVSAAPRVAK